MTGVDLRNARKSLHWTQQEAAGRLGVSQAYLSMLETGKRRVPDKHVVDFTRLYRGHLGPTALPVSQSDAPLPADRVARELAALGYAGYAYLRASPRLNPAELLLRALRCPSLDARLLAGLPWLVLTHADMDWPWVLGQARRRNLQNRVGFVLAVARRSALRLNRTRVARQLARAQAACEASRLANEDAFSPALTQAEKEWVRETRSEDARHWNVLTDLSGDESLYV